GLFPLADGLQLQKGLVKGIGAALFRGSPVKVPSVKEPAVLPLDGVTVVAVVVQLPQLVAAVKNGQAALGKEEGVEHAVQIQALLRPGFHAAKGGGGAAVPGISQPGIVVVKLSPGLAAKALALEVVAEEPLVGHFLHA